MSKPKLTATRLRSLLDYSPETGLFVWKVSRNHLAKVGDVAGSLKNNGYICVVIDGKPYQAHRLAFLWMEGEFPPADVDHRNGVKSDNRWSNLRHAEHWENHGNYGARSNSKSGIRGVYLKKASGKWVASIRLAGRRHHLGSFNTVEEAQAVYNFAAGLVFGHFAHHLSREQ